MRHYACAPRRWQIAPLVRSMAEHCTPFVLHVLAWDWDPDPNWGSPGADVRYVSRADLLERHPELRDLPGHPRSPTDEVCSVRWTHYLDVLDQHGDVTGIDADLWFLSSPEPVYQEIGNAPCAVAPHAFPPASAGLPGANLETHGKYGRHNGGWVYFASRGPAAFMANACRAWCYSEVRDVGGRPWFGDQGPLERMAEAFGAHVVQHPGLDVAPWNIHRYKLGRHFGILTVDSWPLIAYHFSSLRLNPDGTVAQHADAPYQLTEEQISILYEPYLAELSRTRPWG